MTHKVLTDNQLLGERGIALIAELITKLGLVWRPTSVLDSGIDGEIEIRDKRTGAMSGLLLKVQSKAVTNFPKESATECEYAVEQRDLDYWHAHNVPVILIVSRPDAAQAYWQPVRTADGTLKPRRFVFDKERDRLDESAVPALIEYVRSGVAGARGFAQVKRERLLSNLLPVRSLPARLYLAETQFTTYKDVSKALEGKDISFEYSLRSKRILTVRDLTDPRYEFLCDRGTVEDFPAAQWSDSDDPDAQRDFVRVLNQCLKQVLRTSKGRVRYDSSSKTYYFPSNAANTGYSFGYMADKRKADREVVKELRNKKLKHLMGFRHSAMWGRFARYDRKWYLEVTPTYYFTDPGGLKQSRLHPDWLSGIKRLELNEAVRGQLVMWEDLLTSDDLFTQPYPYLSFDRLVQFDTDRGLDDAAWTTNDERAGAAAEGMPAGLFDGL